MYHPFNLPALGDYKISAREKIKFIQSELKKIHAHEAADYLRLKQYLDALCAENNPTALRLSAFLYLNPEHHKIQILAANRRKALEYMKKAATLGDKQAVLFFLKRQKTKQAHLFYQELWNHCLTYRWPETKILWQTLKPADRKIILDRFRTHQKNSKKKQKHLIPPSEQTSSPTPSSGKHIKKLAPQDLWKQITTAGQKVPNPKPIGLDKNKPETLMFYVEISSK